MPFSHTVSILLVVLVSPVSALLIVAILTALDRPPQKRRMRRRDDPSVFLFDGGSLIDASPAARRLLEHLGGRESDLDAVVGLLEHRFPGLRQQVNDIVGDGRVRIAEVGGSRVSGAIEIEYWDGLVRLTLRPTGDGGAVAQVDAMAFEALQDELETLRSIGDDAPQLIWKQDDANRVTWANRVYLALADRVAAPEPGTGAEPPPGAGCGWPHGPIFEDLPELPDDAEPAVRRVVLRLPGAAAKRTYEVTRRRRGAEVVHFAVDVTEVVEAEQTRRKFVQTLTKTFAQLAIGLAIFDRKRQLVMFNPAFHDLTGLPIAFLSSRPQVQTVLDRLRDRNMLPEPKDYASWRDQVAALEAAAAKGNYSETWSLPGGQTYRVTGRPHPDGAIAFLFEDISAEVSLTRHFRSELETAQSVLDRLGEALVVFSASGIRLLHNRAYEAIWGAPETGMRETGVTEEIARWCLVAAPTPTWTRLRDFVGAFGDRADWSDRVRLEDGRGLVCRIVPLPAGATLVGFRPDDAGQRNGDLQPVEIDPDRAIGPLPGPGDTVGGPARPGDAADPDVAAVARLGRS